MAQWSDLTETEREYREQLMHADILIEELVEEREQLIAERERLKAMLGINGERKMVSENQLRLQIIS